MSAYSLSFSVVTYNNEKYIGRMLDSLYEHVKGAPFDIYVIDNGSCDSTPDIIKGKSKNITLIQNEKNLGFGKAHNKVLDMLKSKYHVIINPDVFIDYDVITAMAEYMESNDSVGILTPKVLYPDGSVQRLPQRDPKFRYLLSRRIGLPFLKKHRLKYEMADNADETHDIEFASGCFVFLRTELFKRVGGFDERFFLYFEDADLTRSVRRFARAEYNPAFHVYHDWQRGGAGNARLFFMQVCSMLKYFKKWKTGRGVV